MDSKDGGGYYYSTGDISSSLIRGTRKYSNINDCMNYVSAVVKIYVS